jgi:hypothetical protein
MSIKQKSPPASFRAQSMVFTDPSSAALDRRRLMQNRPRQSYQAHEQAHEQKQRQAPRSEKVNGEQHHVGPAAPGSVSSSRRIRKSEAELRLQKAMRVWEEMGDELFGGSQVSPPPLLKSM